MLNDLEKFAEAAQRLAELYDQSFGGKPSGRYRISPKNLRRLLNRRRISDECKRQLADELFEDRKSVV